jgi:hypothetical protein
MDNRLLLFVLFVSCLAICSMFTPAKVTSRFFFIDQAPTRHVFGMPETLESQEKFGLSRARVI